MPWKYAPNDPHNIDGYVNVPEPQPTRLVNADAIYNTVGLLGDWWDTAPPSQKLQDIASIPGNVLSGIGNQVKSEIENPTKSVGIFFLSF